MTFPLVRAVAAPTPDAEVLFDFNDHGAWSSAATARGLADGWSLGVPARLSAAGDPRTAWGRRKCQFVIEIQGNRASALAAQSRLARWLLRPDGWVMFQLDALSRPVWLRMVGADPGDLSFDRVFVDRQRDTWTLGCSFDAEPFAYGERVTLALETLSQDVAGSPWFETPVIEGDAPARLRLEVGTGSVFNTEFILSGVPAPVSTIKVWQAGTGDGFTAGADTTAVSSSDASGGSWRSVSFATNANRVTRLSGTAPSAPAPGLYRALVRGVIVDATGTTTVPTTLTVDGVESDVVVWRGVNGLPYQWHNYGLFQLPRGSVSLPDFDLTPTAPTFSFTAGRTAGAATAQVDAIVLVPVRLLDDVAETSSLRWASGITAEMVDGVVVDGDYEVARSMVGSSLAAQATATGRTWGGWPEVVPGQVNTVVALGTTAGVAVASTVTASYMPRWLYLSSEAE